MKMEGEFAITDEDRAELLSCLLGGTLDDGRSALVLLEEMGYTIYRKRIVNQARKRVIAKKMTSELAGEIRLYAESHPWLNQLELGLHFGVNPGRVSEALNHLR